MHPYGGIPGTINKKNLQAIIRQKHIPVPPVHHMVELIINRVGIVRDKG